MELSFTPTALASGSRAVFHYGGNVTPPSDYAAWADLIERLARQAVDRYGAGEVRRWFFEVWNEPNLPAFWSGSQADYFRLYRHAAKAIDRVGADLRVGGPATANEEWIEDFLLRERAQEAVRRARGKRVYYTEWNASSNPAFHLHDRPCAKDHANARKLWEAVGEPGYLRPDEVEALHGASELVREPVRGVHEGDVLTFELDVPSHAVAVLAFRH